jgi:acetate kinase
MTLLTVNAGSSSLRLTLFAYDGALKPFAAQRYDGNADAGPERISGFLQRHPVNEITCVAHRVVHGGDTLTAPCIVDAAVEAEIDRLSPLAPLHNPAALKWIRACRTLFGAQVSQVAVFDTAFYAKLPDVARHYALPAALTRRHKLRRYGFHGLAHEAMWRRWRELQPDIVDGGRVISIQLGAGCSITAIHSGSAVDTSMGFTPIEGLVMATRCGDIDPGLLTFLQRAEGLTSEQLEHVLNDESGLLGLSGESADMKHLLDSQQPGARLAVDVYCYRVRKYIGAYLAALGGADAILFGGGVGEHAPTVRSKILSGLETLGISLDTGANRAAIGTQARISDGGSKIEVWVIPVDEAEMLARAAVAITN